MGSLHIAVPVRRELNTHHTLMFLDNLAYCLMLRDFLFYRRVRLHKYTGVAVYVRREPFLGYAYIVCTPGLLPLIPAPFPSTLMSWQGNPPLMMLTNGGFSSVLISPYTVCPSPKFFFFNYFRLVFFKFTTPFGFYACKRGTQTKSLHSAKQRTVR